ncbi:hypothetical protein [Candidatus Marithrix sp. Canyon 246]|uniref:hypothetical protein n=1 Tax=Candidatus Marithrix sp. Canyon 246 TaxID=1827136 RepID=UPI000849FE10|nr:hypothetical protein [Candidatus Marithrix sp. Canyon 246]
MLNIHILFIILLFIVNSTLHAETLDRQVISAAGGNIKIGSNTLRYTIGQAFVSTKSAPQVIIGFWNQAKKISPPKTPKPKKSQAIYESKTLSLENILVPFINEFSGKETGEKGIFTAKLEEKAKLVFELIPWSLNFIGKFSGEDTSAYISYNYKTREVNIPCLLTSTKATIGDVATEGKPKYYKDVIMKQRHPNYPIFHIDEMIEVDSCI